MRMKSIPSYEDIAILQHDLEELQKSDMHIDYYNNTLAILRNRDERLLKEREIRKSFKSQNEDVHGNGNGNGNGNGGMENIIGNNQILTTETAAIRQRLLVVANRLPVSATRKGEASWQLEMSVGGLVSALLGITDFGTKWIGWAGVNVLDEIGQKSPTEALCVSIKDEDVYTFFEPEPPTPVRSSLSSLVNKSSTDHSVGRNRCTRCKKTHPFSSSDGDNAGNENRNGKDTTPSILDFNSNNYFSCAVKRKHLSPRYLLSSSADVVSLLQKMVDASSEG